jgi:carbamoyltransferase
MDRSFRKILGLNSAGIGTSSALVIDGKLVFAVEEERLNREKRTRQFPVRGIKEALQFADISFEDLDAVAIAWNPAVNLEAFNPQQSRSARYLGEIFYNVPNHLMTFKRDSSPLFSEQSIRFEDGREIQIYYVLHHLAHASAFFVSPFENAAVLAVDAFGEKNSFLAAVGEGNTLKTQFTQEFPHSLGSFYSAMTEYIGFSPKSDEWKLMGAGSYGDPDRFYKELRSLVSLKKNGFELDLSYFNHYQFHRPFLYTPKLSQLLNLPPNTQGAELSSHYFDLAAAAQRVFEDIYFHLLVELHSQTRQENLVLSGGVALNSVANGKIPERTPFRQVFVPPTPDDSGGSLGAAYWVYHEVGKEPRKFVLASNSLGPEYSDNEIARELTQYKLEYRKLSDPSRTAADLINDGKIIGWFQGRLEYGDRALGNRSILADPRDHRMKDRLNASVKYRESFRPFAPSVLWEYAEDFFLRSSPTPFMERVLPIREEKRPLIPAVTHVDGTGRLHTVEKETNPGFRKLIDEFRKITGIPLVMNTSFNLKDEPIVCSPKDALRTFFSSGLDALILGSYLLEKKGS